MKYESIYGNCSCGYQLAPVYFEERELVVDAHGHLIWLDRYKKICSHLVCESCGKNHCVDDSFDGSLVHKERN